MRGSRRAGHFTRRSASSSRKQTIFVAASLWQRRGSGWQRKTEDPCGPQLATAAAERRRGTDTRAGHCPSNTHTFFSSASALSGSGVEETRAGSQQTVSLNISLFCLVIHSFEDGIFFSSASLCSLSRWCSACEAFSVAAASRWCCWNEMTRCKPTAVQYGDVSVNCLFKKCIWMEHHGKTDTHSPWAPTALHPKEGGKRLFFVCLLQQQHQQHQQGLCVSLLLLPAGAHRPHSAQRIIWCLAEMLTDVAALPWLFSSTQRQGTMPLRPFPNELLYVCMYVCIFSWSLNGLHVRTAYCGRPLKIIVTLWIVIQIRWQFEIESDCIWSIEEDN